MEVLKKAGNSQNFIYHLQRILRIKPKRAIWCITAATVKQLREEVHSGVPATTRLLAWDVLAVNPKAIEDVVVEDHKLQECGLQ